jgi:hypothetical protein
MATPLILDYMPRRQFVSFHERSERFACIVTHRRAGKIVDSLDVRPLCHNLEVT